IQPESGLVTVTILGAVLANQQRVSVHHLIEFKENLRTILVSILFILLAARVEWQQMVSVGVPGLILLAALVFLVRPLSVLIATWRTTLDWREKAFLCCMAPRGVVAAAVSSVFALKIVGASEEVRIDEATQQLQDQAGQMVSLTYL